MMMLDQSAAVWSTVAFAAAALGQSECGLADVPVPASTSQVPLAIWCTRDDSGTFLVSDVLVPLSILMV